MKLPASIGQVTVIDDFEWAPPYPCLGFVPVREAEIGNGDYFGLYWPLGWEDREPIVCLMAHDAWALMPKFLSLDDFLRWLVQQDDDVFTPDKNPFSQMLSAGHEAMLKRDLPTAVSLYERYADILPESAECWFQLRALYRRVDEHEKAAEAAVRCYLSNWNFGFPNPAVLRTLRALRKLNPNHANPIVRRSEQLTLTFGGVRENPVYKVMQKVIDDFLNMGDAKSAVSLFQNFGYMMTSETTSFQERNGFSREKWRSDLVAMTREALGHSRLYQP